MQQLDLLLPHGPPPDHGALLRGHQLITSPEPHAAVQLNAHPTADSASSNNRAAVTQSTSEGVVLRSAPAGGSSPAIVFQTASL